MPRRVAIETLLTSESARAPAAPPQPAWRILGVDGSTRVLEDAASAGLSLEKTPSKTPAPTRVDLPLAKTELSSLLANDPMLCVNHRVRPTLPENPLAGTPPAIGPPSPTATGGFRAEDVADPRLLEVVAAWSGLASPIHAAILALVRS